VSVERVREIAAISHRLLGRACIAQARPRWPVCGRVCCGGDGGSLGADRYACRRIPAMAVTVVARHAS